MLNNKHKVESILFTTGKFMTVEEIAKICNLDMNLVLQILEELKQDYSKRDSALELQQDSSKYKLNIKKEYGYLTNRLVSTKELDNPTVKTLAVIAYKQPVLQSIIIKIRGNKSYDHIKSLVEQGLINSEKHSRTRLLKLTPKFYDYFDTAAEEVKNKFKEIKRPEPTEEKSL